MELLVTVVSLDDETRNSHFFQVFIIRRFDWRAPAKYHKKFMPKTVHRWQSFEKILTTIIMIIIGIYIPVVFFFIIKWYLFIAAFIRPRTGRCYKEIWLEPAYFFFYTDSSGFKSFVQELVRYKEVWLEHAFFSLFFPPFFLNFFK